MEFLIGVILGIIGAGLCVYFASLLLSPLSTLLKIGSEKTKVKKTSQETAKIEQLISSNKVDSALSKIKKSFLLKTPKTIQSVSEIRNHNQNLLSHCLTISEIRGSKLNNIAKVEHLLLERTELFSLHIKAKESFDLLKSKRKEEGKKTPVWSKNEFESKIKKIEEELSNNKTNIDAELKTLFSELSKESSENITYH